MAFSSTVQPVTKPSESAPLNHVPDALLAMVLASIYAANNSKKALRKLKYKLMWDTFKLKVKSLFAKKPAGDISNRTLLILLVALLALVLLLTVSWQTAVVLLLAGILIVLLLRI